MKLSAFIALVVLVASAAQAAFSTSGAWQWAAAGVFVVALPLAIVAACAPCFGAHTWRPAYRYKPHDELTQDTYGCVVVTRVTRVQDKCARCDQEQMRTERENIFDHEKMGDFLGSWWCYKVVNRGLLADLERRAAQSEGKKSRS